MSIYLVPYLKNIRPPSPKFLPTLPSSLNISPIQALAPSTSLAENFTTVTPPLTSAAVHKTPSAFSLATRLSFHLCLDDNISAFSLPSDSSFQLRSPIRGREVNSSRKNLASVTNKGPCRRIVPNTPAFATRADIPSQLFKPSGLRITLSLTMRNLRSFAIILCGSLWLVCAGITSQISFLPFHPAIAQLSPRARRPSVTQSITPTLAPFSTSKICFCAYKEPANGWIGSGASQNPAPRQMRTQRSCRDLSVCCRFWTAPFFEKLRARFPEKLGAWSIWRSFSGAIGNLYTRVLPCVAATRRVQGSKRIFKFIQSPARSPPP